MSEVFGFLLLGIGSGALISGAGMGVVLSYRGAGVINLAAAAIAMLAGYFLTLIFAVIRGVQATGSGSGA